MNRYLCLLPFVVAALFPEVVGAVAQEAFRYYPPGELSVGSGRKGDRTIYLPQLFFPLQAGPQHQNAHAYANSQIHPIGGSGNANGNYAYPWRDTYCERRSWDMPLCPGNVGHQGLDIRPQKPTANTYPAFAMDDGVIASITNNTTLTIRSNSGYTCRYLHLDRASIIQAGMAVGSAVRRGAPVGRVSNIMGGKPNTTIHLHFDCYKSIAGRVVRLPLFTSVIAAYRRAWGLSDLNVGGQLSADPVREVGATGAAIATNGAATGPTIAIATDPALPKSLRTKNFGAITPITEPVAWPAYILNWPGLITSVEIRDVFGKIIPAFATDEAGVGLWWYWMVQRAGFGAAGVVSFERIAIRYSGASSASEPAVKKYLAAYSGVAATPGLSKQYFGRFIDAHEELSLADLETRWKIAQTIFHNEAGKPGSVDRATFDRGIQLADGILANGFPTAVGRGRSGGTTASIGAASPGGIPPYVVGGGPGGSASPPPATPSGAANVPGGIEIFAGRYTIRILPGTDSASITTVLDTLEKRN